MKLFSCPTFFLRIMKIMQVRINNQVSAFTKSVCLSCVSSMNEVSLLEKKMHWPICQIASRKGFNQRDGCPQTHNTQSTSAISLCQRQTAWFDQCPFRFQSKLFPQLCIRAQGSGERGLLTPGIKQWIWSRCGIFVVLCVRSCRCPSQVWDLSVKN